MKIVLANGCFDVFHIGHLRHFQAAAKLGYLVVSVTRDEFVNKGPGRPIFNQFERAGIIQSLRCVKSVIFSDNALDALEQIKPDIFVKGQDYKGKIEKKHLAYCKKHKIKIAFTNEPAYSSTKIIRELRRR